MGVVDDLHNEFAKDDEPDTYAVSDTRREEGTEVGVVPPENLLELIEEHSDACRAFQIRSGAGYVDPHTINSDLSQAEHAGRVGIDMEGILNSLSDGLCTCHVRLDTNDPQLVKVIEGSSEKQVEIDGTVARFVSPTGNEREE